MSAALLSRDEVYRWWLTRDWVTNGNRRVIWVMCNPSTADATLADATVRKCEGFTKRWGYGGLLVVNLYAFRTTWPEFLWKADDPVGEDNDSHLRHVIGQAVAKSLPVIAAWGGLRPAASDPWSPAMHLKRVEEVNAILKPASPFCLGATRHGQPRHPLMLPYSTKVERYAA